MGCAWLTGGNEVTETQVPLYQEWLPFLWAQWASTGKDRLAAELLLHLGAVERTLLYFVSGPRYKPALKEINL